MTLREIRTDDAPAPVGPYSQAVQHGSALYVSGQIPLDPATGKLVPGDIARQAERVIDNLEAVLRSGGSSLEQVIRATVYLTDLADFPRVNEIYASRFTGDPAPARATVQVAALPLGADIEIDAIAVVPEP
ncbi:MAG: RidA family protein [Myxococcales bacterium]|nr:RidA family protein [Myxococcales bacterium]